MEYNTHLSNEQENLYSENIFQNVHKKTDLAVYH
jgi:hypothetical protein